MSQKDKIDSFLKNLGDLDPELKDYVSSLEEIVKTKKSDPRFRKAVLKGLKKTSSSMDKDGKEALNHMINRFL